MKLFLSILPFIVLFNLPAKPTKVTAYRFIEQHNDGPCYIGSCINSEDYKGDIARATCNDATLARKLINFRDEITSNTSIPFHCGKHWIGGDVTDAIIVLHGKTNDTLFFSEKRNLLIIPSQNKAYTYPREVFLNTLNSKMNTFFTDKFETERRRSITEEK
nr:hypothetical protein [uncultured Flavobacterium sp.]